MIISGCSPDHYKDDADRILDEQRQKRYRQLECGKVVKVGIFPALTPNFKQDTCNGYSADTLKLSHQEWGRFQIGVEIIPKQQSNKPDQKTNCFHSMKRRYKHSEINTRSICWNTRSSMLVLWIVWRYISANIEPNLINSMKNAWFYKCRSCKMTKTWMICW